MIKSWQWCPTLRNVSCYYYPHLSPSLSHRERLQKTTTAHQQMPGPGALVSASCTRLRCPVQKGVHGDLHGHWGVSPSPATDWLCGPGYEQQLCLPLCFHLGKGNSPAIPMTGIHFTRITDRSLTGCRAQRRAVGDNQQTRQRSCP